MPDIQGFSDREFLPFDLSPVPSAKLSDLSKTIFENEYLPAAFAPDVLEENNRSYEERLSSCRMILAPDDTVPTVLGLLAIGKNPQDFIYGGYLQFLRIDGTELGDPVVDELKATGNLAVMIHRVEEKLTAHNKKAYDISRGRPCHYGRLPAQGNAADFV
jgi:ATP-dependent DNA helicase RecG